MFTIDITESDEIVIASNDRGDWVVKASDWATTIEGFGGENQIIIARTCIQSGVTAVHITYLTVDSYIGFAHRDVAPNPTDRWGTKHVARAINELLTKLLVYPEHI